MTQKEETEDTVCEHQWEEAVDEEGELIEPPYDVCVQCGLENH